MAASQPQHQDIGKSVSEATGHHVPKPRKPTPPRKPTDQKTRITDVFKGLTNPNDPWWVRVIMLLMLVGAPYRVVSSDACVQLMHWALVHLPR
jgi:hypothetical protein